MSFVLKEHDVEHLADFVRIHNFEDNICENIWSHDYKVCTHNSFPPPCCDQSDVRV